MQIQSRAKTALEHAKRGINARYRARTRAAPAQMRIAITAGNFARNSRRNTIRT